MDLVKEAKKAMEQAYAPYSNFKVGAAILMKDGNIIHGANVENGSYGLSNCAERSALFSAYSQGYQKDDIVEMAIIADSNHPISPCGACRQVISELVPRKAKITLASRTYEKMQTTIEELLPYQFSLDEEKR